MAPKGVKKIMRDLMKKMGRVSAPLLVHLGITSAAAYIGIMMYMVLGYRETDDAVLTVFSAVCCFPALWWMWKRDRGGSVIFVEKETIAEGKTSVEKEKTAGLVLCGGGLLRGADLLSGKFSDGAKRYHPVFFQRGSGGTVCGKFDGSGYWIRADCSCGGGVAFQRSVL